MISRSSSLMSRLSSAAADRRDRDDATTRTAIGSSRLRAS
jgi:hypothetical protein